MAILPAGLLTLRKHETKRIYTNSKKANRKQYLL